MPRYNMRTLRGERVIKKKEGERIKRWKLDYKRFINDAKNILSVEEVMEEIAQTFENNAIEQEKVTLICPLTKERIVVPSRYETCRHLQCFDLEGFLAMKSKRNFLECPICNTKVDSELTGLRIDKYFQNMLSDVSGATEIEIFGDGTFKRALSHLAPIIPKVIDDEGPYVPYHSATLISKVKSETDSNVDNAERLDSVSISQMDAEIKGGNAETQRLHILDSSMASDINRESSLSKAKAGSKNEEKRFKCGDCSYFTKYKHVLLAHKRIHTREKPFKCTQCSYESARADILKKHMRTHTGEKPYKCSLCSYTCARFDRLKNHMRTHSGEKPYKCDQCSYASIQSGKLKLHILTHTGEKPYKCNQCSFASIYSGSLKSHMATHTNEKPFKCSQCSHTCARAIDLASHMRTHTGEKPYKCDHCTYTSAFSSGLKVHMRTHV